MSEQVSAERVAFWRSFGLLVSGGFPLSQVLDSASQGMDRKFSNIVSDVKNTFKNGVAFSDALAEHGETFSKFEVDMVRTGEAAGNLDVMAKRLAKALADMGSPKA